MSKQLKFFRVLPFPGSQKSIQEGKTTEFGIIDPQISEFKLTQPPVGAILFS